MGISKEKQDNLDLFNGRILRKSAEDSNLFTSMVMREVLEISKDTHDVVMQADNVDIYNFCVEYVKSAFINGSLNG